MTIIADSAMRTLVLNFIRPFPSVAFGKGFGYARLPTGPHTTNDLSMLT